MRTTAFIQALLASFVLSACASGPARDVPPRTVSTDILRPRTLYPVQSHAMPLESHVMPVVDRAPKSEMILRESHK
jgi:hypothetical protein